MLCKKPLEVNNLSLAKYLNCQILIMAHDNTNVKKYSNLILHCHLVLVQSLVQGRMLP